MPVVEKCGRRRRSALNRAAPTHGGQKATRSGDRVSWFVKEFSGRSLPFTLDGFSFASDIIRDIQRGRIMADDDIRRATAVLAKMMRGSNFTGN
jgi:hypothetical protein